MKSKMYWKGKDVETLTKEELIEALEYQTNRLSEHTTSQAIKDRVRGQVERFKEGTR